ncbi:MAG: TlpA family protein disulfide reductase [Acidobacteria bacterium]|nr:TlpA family protein disulfide reductase [Acidobacteriota bacterium]
MQARTSARLVFLAAALAVALFAGVTPRPASDLTFTTHDGKKVSLADYKGKPVVVFFFSTDCPHCQRAAAQMAPLYPELKKKGIEILGLAMNPTAKTNLNGFIKNHSVAFPTGVSSDKQFRGFANLTVMQNFYYPYMLFVDPAGQIREEHQGAERSWYGNFEFNLLKSIDNISAK